jgi:hypothetical protein
MYARAVSFSLALALTDNQTTPRGLVQEAIVYAPTYYKKMLDQSITRSVIPAPKPAGSRSAARPANLAVKSGLEFGPDAYRRQLSARIAFARGEMESQQTTSARGTLSKTARERVQRQQQQQSSQSATPTPPQGRVSGRRPMMLRRVADEAPPLSAR